VHYALIERRIEKEKLESCPVFVSSKVFVGDTTTIPLSATTKESTTTTTSTTTGKTRSEQQEWYSLYWRGRRECT
jgi:hypothetical protein